MGRIRLCAGEAVPPGAVVAVTVGDEDLVVWRGHDGVVCVMEARCPHQWSHLAAEGAVDGDELVCCSHWWRFRRDGSGWKVNVNGRRDRKGDIVVLPVDEDGDGVWVERPESGR